MNIFHVAGSEAYLYWGRELFVSTVRTARLRQGLFRGGEVVAGKPDSSELLVFFGRCTVS